MPDRRPVTLGEVSPSDSRTSEDLHLMAQQQNQLPVRSVTVDNFRFAANCEDSQSPESSIAMLRPSLRNRPPVDTAATVPDAPQPQPMASSSADSQKRLSGRPDTVTTYSEVCASTDTEDSQASTLPVDSQSHSTQPVAAAAAASARRSRIASGASSLDSDDLMLSTDCDVEDADAGGSGCGADDFDDNYGGCASLTASRAGGDLAECLIREEEEYEDENNHLDGQQQQQQANQAPTEDIVGSLMTASLPPDSLARHLRRQQQPPLSLSLAAGSLRFRPRSVSSPQGDLLLLPGSDLRHLAHDVTGLKTMLLRLRRQLLDDGRASVTATPTGCCSVGDGATVCQLCGSDAKRVAELEGRVADLQAEVDALRRRLPEEDGC